MPPAGVGLLKIDVEGAEGRVLAGLPAARWPQVAQVVIEVHDVAERVAAVTDFLEQQAFRVRAVRAEANNVLVYALRL